MYKKFCDKCDKEIGKGKDTVDIEVSYLENGYHRTDSKSLHICKDCYKKFQAWLMKKD